MLSTLRFKTCVYLTVDISVRDTETGAEILWNKPHLYSKRLFNATSLTVSFFVDEPSWHSVSWKQIIGLKLLFSFHPPGRVPTKATEAGLFNCSVDYFSDFRQHLDCDHVIDCEGAEDEGSHCSACHLVTGAGSASDGVSERGILSALHSHPSASKGRENRSHQSESLSNNVCPFCSGGVANPHNGKCYLVKELRPKPKDFSDYLRSAREACGEVRGGRLAVVSGPRDVHSLSITLGKSLWRKTGTCKIYPTVAMKNDGNSRKVHKDYPMMGVFLFLPSVPSMYRQVWLGDDGTVIYTPQPDFFVPHSGGIACLIPNTFIRDWLSFSLDPLCSVRASVVCETDSGKSASSLKSMSSDFKELSSKTSDTLFFPKMLLNASLTKLPARRLSTYFVPCPKGHVTHSFLQCDVRSFCGVTASSPSCLLHQRNEKLAASGPAMTAHGLMDLKQEIQTQESTASNKLEKLSDVISDSNAMETPSLGIASKTRDTQGLGTDLPTSVSTSEPKERTSHGISVQQFACSDGSAFIHYTLVCDFRPDCLDQSDESFCNNPPCNNTFKCSNGQCVSYYKRGDFVSDCVDDSDEIMEETYVSYSNTYNLSTLAVTPPLIIHFNRNGFYKEKLGAKESCPDTHYRCPGLPTICLPVYTRCNGYYDCQGREDEKNCEEGECPGFYRCLDSPVCVHPDHLCDGLPQCPARDDEWLCEEEPCPNGCSCQGLAFVCRQSFSVSHFPNLRYLDGSESGISLSAIQPSVYLIYLVLSHCHLNSCDIINLDNLNLQHLDLSHNNLEEFSMSTVVRLVNLKTLRLAHNPLTSLTSGKQSTPQTALTTLDLSYTQLASFSSKPLEHLPLLKVLNVSHSPVDRITSDAFRYCPFLVELDLRGNPISTFPLDVFQNLSRLEKVDAENYRLCCKTVLPPHMNQHFCTAPEDEMSSCDDLLRSGVYKVFSWVICVLSVTGNLFCLGFRTYLHKSAAKSAFNLFVSSLGVADLLMGVYIAIIAAADASFLDRYLFHEQGWISSSACKTAGFLSLLSSEVSALTILLITFDRFVVLRFPFSTFRFGKTSAGIATLVTWTVGIVLAAVPLLPAFSFWKFYSQTGICIPLPVLRRHFPGQTYSVAILIFLNVVLFLFIAAGQAFIYWSVLKNALVTDNTRQSRDTVIARRLITVAVTDFLCWFPIGLCGLLAWTGTAISGEVSVAMAMMVLPINAALNPFLYTFNVVVEKRRKTKEEKLLQKLSAKPHDFCPNVDDERMIQ